MAHWVDSLIDHTLERLGYTKAERSTAALAVLAGEAPLFQQPTGDSAEATERLAVTSAWVYSDIQLIANEASQARLKMMKQEGEKRVEVYDHPFERIMQTPSRRGGTGKAQRSVMSGQFMRRYTFLWWMLRGEAYWAKGYDMAGDLAELWPLPSSRVEPIPDAQSYLGGYWYTNRTNGQPLRLAAEDVCFFRFPNPFDYYRGLSPLSAARLGLETDREAARWNQRTFKDDVALKTLVSLPKELSRTEFAERKAELLEQLIERQRRYLVVRAGDVTAEPLSLGAKDMEYMAGRTFTREELDRVFNIPAGFWAKEATRANSDAALAVVINMAIWPMLSLMADEITSQIVQPEYGEEYRVEFEDIRPADRQLLMQERQIYWQVKTINEARAELGMDPLPDPALGGQLFGQGGGAQPAPGLSDMRGSALPGGMPARALPAPGGMPAKALPAPGSSISGGQAREDLRRWRGIALRRLKAGEPPGGYAFESEALPAEVKAAIAEALGAATTEEEVKAAFAAGFRGLTDDWQSYP